MNNMEQKVITIQDSYEINKKIDPLLADGWLIKFYAEKNDRFKHNDNVTSDSIFKIQ